MLAKNYPSSKTISSKTSSEGRLTPRASTSAAYTDTVLGEQHNNTWPAPWKLVCHPLISNITCSHQIDSRTM